MSLTGEGVTGEPALVRGDFSARRAALCCSLHVTPIADGGSADRCHYTAPELAPGPAEEDGRCPEPEQVALPCVIGVNLVSLGSERAGLTPPTCVCKHAFAGAHPTSA